MQNIVQFLVLEEIAKIAHIFQRLVKNCRDFFNHFDHVFARAQSQNIHFYQAPSQKPIPTISSEIIATITAIIMALIKNQNPILATFTFISLL